MYRKALIIFFLFSAIYSFSSWTGDSYLHLGNDTSFQGLLSYHRVYKETFSDDPILSNLGIYYTPTHIMILTTLLKATDSFMLSLKIFLFFQLFLTLISNCILLRTLFNRSSLIENVLLSLLIAVPFVMLPYGCSVGFGGIGFVEARNTFGILTPLLLLSYYRDQPINIFNRKFPNIVLLGFVFGLLVNIHPPSGINIFAVLLIHWAIFRAKKFGDVLIIIAASIIFLATSATFLYPYMQFEFNKVAMSGELVEYSRSIKDRFRSLLWLLELSYIPFFITLLLVVLGFGKKIYENLESKDLFHFLKTLFIVAYIVEITGAFLWGNVSFMGRIAYPLMRTERFAFYLLELLIVFSVVYGKGLLMSDNKTLNIGDRIHLQKPYFAIILRIFPIRLINALASVVSTWWLYAIYVVAAISLAATSMLLVQLSGFSGQKLVQGGILVLTVLSLVLPTVLCSPPKLHYVFSAGLISCLITLGNFPWGNRSVDTLKVSLSVVVISLLVIFIYKFKPWGDRVSKQLFVIYLTMLLIAVPAV